MRRVRYGKMICRGCGRYITKNALGRAAHYRACPGRPEPTMKLKPRSDL